MTSEETAKAKAWGQFKLQVLNVLQIFNTYGLGHDIPGAVEEITDLAILAHKNLSGQPAPITRAHARSRAAKRRKGK